MPRHTLRLWLLIFSTITIANTAFANQEIQVRSGNGTLGSQDSQVRVLSYERLGDVTPSASDFVTAQTEPFAYVVADSAYITSLPSDPGAQWIAARANKAAVSALYAIPFEVTDTVVTNAILDFHFAVDNAVNGVYINGSRISGNSYDGDYHTEYRFVRDDIAPLLHPHSTNWLYVNVSDFGVISALIFSARITVTSSTQFGITPNVGGNAGKVTVRISAPGITTGATAKLATQGQPDILGEDTEILSGVENSNVLGTTFDLRGAAPGFRDVIVALSDNSSFTLPSGFQVLEGGRASLTVELLGPSVVRAGRDATFLIVVRNTGLIDAELISLELLRFGEQISPTTASLPSAPPIIPYFPSIPAGSQVTAPIPLNSVVGCSTIGIKVRSFRDNCEIIKLQKNAIGAYLSALYGLRLANLLLIFSAYTTPRNNPICGNPNHPIANRFCNSLKNADDGLERYIQQIENADDFLSGRSAALGCPEPLFDKDDLENLGVLAGAVREEIDRLETLRLLQMLPPDAPEVKDAYNSLDVFLTQALTLPSNITFPTFAVDDEPLPDTQTAEQICAVTSLDPNDKVGPEGTGFEHYLGATAPIPYTISFENSPLASASAREITITDQLDSALDWTTVSFGYVKIGNRIVQVPVGGSDNTAVMDLRPERQLLVTIRAQVNSQTGLVTWHFNSIDPATGVPPTDPLIGFLPPNLNAPEGEGSVFYTVLPKGNLATNVAIRNRASILFDQNNPIVTQDWLNTIDSSLPSSHVHPLGGQSPPAFVVQWSGTDEGSGVKDFTIYVSDNGGPYVPWLNQTVNTHAIFTGVPNHTYSFFSLARDFANNYEVVKTEAETSTLVMNHSPSARGNNITVVANNSCTASVTPAELDNGSSDPDGDSIVLSLAPSGPFALGSHSVLLTATDSYGASDSTTVTITVIDKSPPTISNVSATPSVIWPPNKDLVDVVINYETSDCSRVSSHLNVRSNEPLDSSDVEILDAHHLRLRRDRLGNRSGRIYTVTVLAIDDYGNLSSKDVRIYVPHDQRR